MIPEISVVIPVFNAERFLPECVSSLCAQTLQNCEFIFVDDGSSDGSPALLEEAAGRDPRIRILSNPVNSGVSAARNRGIDAARGTYLGFCDADDTMDPPMLEVLVEACRNQRAQAAFCRVFKDRASESVNVPLGFADGTVFEGEEIKKTLIPAMLSLEKDGDDQPLSGYSPRNVFLRETVGSIRYREDIHYAEDLLFIVSVMLRCSRVTAVDRAYYHYRFYEGSTTKKYSPYIPESLERSNAALLSLLEGEKECSRRMAIRRRKMAVDTVRNYCSAGTPFSFLQRIREIRAYMNRKDVQEDFRELNLGALSKRTALRLGLVKYRCAAVCAVLYSTIFKSRM